jgi:energy-coupling factor transporter ATP-binding protein EcfA2
MWIERLEFIGFGNLTGQRIEFGRNKLSIVVQPNEYGKSTMTEAMWAMLFDYPEWNPANGGARPGYERKPLSGAAFKAVMDVATGDKEMRLIRNFADRQLKILDLTKDLGKANADITAEFGEAVNTEQFGRNLTGLTRNLFRSCCILGQRELDRKPFAGDRVLASLLLNIADRGGTTFNVIDAIARLEDRLESFPFRGKTHDSQELIAVLETQREYLAENLKRLETERDSCDREVERLLELESRFQALNKKLAIDEYFQLCLELADVDSRLSRAQEKSGRIKELQGLIQAYAKYEHFPIERQKDIEELWISRQSRLSDLRRMESEVKTKSVETQIRDLEMRERSEGLEDFSIEDAQLLSNLARTFKEVTNDLQETRARREQEFERVMRNGVDLNQLADVRVSLLSLEPKELDEAQAYQEWMDSLREQAADGERTLERARTTVKEILEQREGLVRVVQKIFWPSLVLAIGFLLTFLYLMGIQHMALSEAPVTIVLLMYALLFIAAGISFFGSQRIRAVYRINDETVARTEESRQSTTLQELGTKINGIDGKMEALARKAGLGSGTQLVRNMKAYAVSAMQLKELDMLDHMILSKEAHVAQLKQQLAEYFRRANRPVEEVSAEMPKEAMKLAEALNWYHDNRRRREGSNFMDHRESEIRFLTDEVRHAESLLCDHFQRAGLTFSEVNEGYYAWTEAIVAYRRWESNRNELQRLEQDTTTDLVPSELPRIIERLEGKKNDLWMRIQELIINTPEIAAAPPPIGEEMIGEYSRQISEVRAQVDELRREREEITVQLRASMKNYQDNYLKMLEELEAVERDLKHVKHQRTALLLARDTFLRLADENHTVWADKLNDITREMLKALGTEYEAIEFDADLSMSVRRKGQRDALNEWHIQEQLSTGTREQLHWLARMAVVRFLSNNRPLPLVLDEPFSEFDDERFLKIMRFVINNIARHNQVIIFSCHQQRHEWLMDQLDPREREAVELCRLQPMKTDAASAARR